MNSERDLPASLAARSMTFRSDVEIRMLMRLTMLAVFEVKKGRHALVGTVTQHR